jgi:hypothetical protein
MTSFNPQLIFIYEHSQILVNALSFQTTQIPILKYLDQTLTDIKNMCPSHKPVSRDAGLEGNKVHRRQTEPSSCHNFRSDT